MLSARNSLSLCVCALAHMWYGDECCVCGCFVGPTALRPATLPGIQDHSDIALPLCHGCMGKPCRYIPACLGKLCTVLPARSAANAMLFCLLSCAHFAYSPWQPLQQQGPDYTPLHRHAQEVGKRAIWLHHTRAQALWQANMPQVALVPACHPCPCHCWLCCSDIHSQFAFFPALAK